MPDSLCCGLPKGIWSRLHALRAPPLLWWILHSAGRLNADLCVFQYLRKSNLTQEYCPSSYVGFGNLYTYSNFSCTTNFVNFTWSTAPYFNNTVYTCPVSGIDFNSAILYTAIGVDNSGNSQAWMGKNVTTVLLDKNVLIYTMEDKFWRPIFSFGWLELLEPI